MNKRIIKIIVLLLLVNTCNAQNYISFHLSGGYMNHLQRKGINTEFGINITPINRLDFSVSLRYSPLLYSDFGNVIIKAINSNISFVVINNQKHKLMFGPGISYGNYERTYSDESLEKEYNAWWFNPIKIRYDYSILEKFNIGADISLYGDDGDTSTYYGLVFSYIL